MGTASYEAVIEVVDEAAVRAFARKLNPDLEDDLPIEEALDEVLVNPRVPPLESGYEIVRQVVAHDHANRYRMRLEASVGDEALLLASAQESHRAAYGGDELEADNLGHVLYEHVLGSNASPPDSEVGFQVMHAWYEGADLPRAPAP